MDLRLTLRLLAKSPGFTLSAVLTLALGIAATAALFTVVDAVLLRPLAVRHPEELVTIHCDLRGQGVRDTRVSVPELEDLRNRTGAFAEVAMTFPMNGNVTGIERPERVEALAVTPNYFRLLGTPPTLGRTFGEPEETVPGWAQGVVLSDRAWKVLFGGDTSIIGRTFWMDYDTFRVVGVMPPSFRHPGATLSGAVDVWFTGGLRTPPFAAQPDRAQRIIPGLIARLAPGVTVAEAQNRMASLASALRSEHPSLYPASADWRPRAVPLLQDLTANARPVLLILLASSACLVLICCASIACLQLARTAARTREIAVRTAIGATPGMLVRSCLAENLVIATLGAVAGLLAAQFLVPALLRLAPADLPRAETVAVDYRVAGFTLALALITGLLLSLAPVRHLLRIDLSASLKEGAGGSTGGRGAARWRAWLVSAQIAIAVVLLSAAGLLVRSVWNLLQADPGFTSERVVVANLWLPPPTDPSARQTYLTPANRVQFMRSLVTQVGAIPGVDAVAVGAGQSVPFTTWRANDLMIEGRETPQGAAPQARLCNVTPGYFGILGLTLLEGRLLREADDGATAVAVIDDTAARQLWPGQKAIGRRFAIGRPARPQWVTVVGIVSSMKTDGFDAPFAPHVYLSAYQRSALDLTVVVRSALPAGGLAEPLRRIVRSIDPDLPVFNVRALDEIVARTQAQRRFALVVVVFFASAALLLAAIGVFGLASLTTVQRRREFGVRIALGANARQVSGLVFGQTIRLGLAGLLAGLAPAMGLSSLLGSLLYGVQPVDPLTFAGIAAVLSGTVLLASWPAALRAANANPMDALRAD